MGIAYKKIWNDLLRRFPAIAGEEAVLPEDVTATSRSASMEAVLNGVLRLHGYLSPILLQGEPGTGKQFWARVIHRLSPRAAGPFVAVDLEAVPARLLDAFLFGTEAQRPFLTEAGEYGKIRQAIGGTLYLHAIERLPAVSQRRLLELLRRKLPSGTDHSGRSPGGNGSHYGEPVANPLVRILAGTSADLGELVRRGIFRRDLYYRLSVFPLQLPPLRDRGEDLPALTEYFLRRFARIMGKKARRADPGSFEWMRRYYWPGNLDELREFVLLNLHFAAPQAETIRFRLLPEILRRAAANPAPKSSRKWTPWVNRRENLV